MTFDWERFKQSNVARIFVAYAVVVFASMQILDYLLPIIEAPLWVAQTLTIVLFLGFPISLLIGWAYQKTSADLSEDRPKADKGGFNMPRQKLIMIGLAASALFGFLGLVLMPYMLDQAAYSPAAKSSRDQNILSNFRSFRSRVLLGATGVRGLHNTRTDIAISKDGMTLAYLDNQNGSRLYIRDLASAEPEDRLIGDLDLTNGSGLMFFSQNGEWLHFINGAQLARVRIEGGAFQIIDTGSSVLRSSFTAYDDKVIFSDTEDSQLHIIPASGGQVQSILPSMDGQAAEKVFTWPRVLPGNEYLMVTTSDSLTRVGIGDIEVLNVADGSRDIIIQNASNATYVSSGHIVFVRDSDLWAVAFDLESMSVKGSEVPVIENVETNSQYGFATYAISENGKLFYLPGSDVGAILNSGIVNWISTGGDRVETEIEAGSYSNISLSPTEDRLVFTSFDASGAGSDIFVWDLNRKTLGRRTFDGVATNPIWSQDGQYLIYSHGNEGIKSVAANGTQQPKFLFESNSKTRPFGLSEAGELIFDMGVPPKMYYVSLADVSEPAENPAIELELAPQIVPFHALNLSPDANWVAYVSNETGSAQVYVRPFPQIDRGKWQVSTTAVGAHPIWNSEGKEIFYFSGGSQQIMSVPYEIGEHSVDQDPTLIEFGRPQSMFSRALRLGPTLVPMWDYSETRGQFMMVESEDSNLEANQDSVLNAQTNLVVVEDFFSELRSLAPRLQSNLALR